MDTKKYIFGVTCCLLSSTLLAIAPVPSQLLPRLDASRTGRELQEYTKPIKPKAKISTQPESKSVPTSKGKEVSFVLKKVIISGETEYTLATLEQFYQPYLGKKVTFSDLQKITYDITEKYRNDGYLLTKAILPSQQVKDGVVHVQIIEGFIDHIKVEGDAANASIRKLIAGYGEQIKKLWLFRTPFSLKALERYILLANDLPGIDISTILSPSKTTLGGTDLTFVVTYRPIDASIYFNNYGTRYLGPQQIGAALHANGVLGTTASAGINAIESATNNDVTSVNIFYSQPLGLDGTTLNLNAILTETNPSFKFTPLSPAVDFVGKSKEFTVDLGYPFIRSRIDNLYFQAKFDWLDSNTDWPAIQTNLFEDQIRSLRIGLLYDRTDQLRGINAFELWASQGLLIGGAHNYPATDFAHPVSRAGAAADYTKINFNLSRWQALFWQLSFLISIQTQYSFDPLLSSEELSFGGRAYGRGYDPSEITGDSGAIGRVELRQDWFTNFSLLNHLQPFIFYDAGILWNKDADITDQQERLSATSAGVGIRLNFTNHIFGQIEIDKPLTHKVQALIDAGHGPRDARIYFHIAAIL